MTITTKRNGFSLIELLVVATIIIVLAAIGMVSFANAGKNARDGKRKADMESVRQALVIYRTSNSAYPTQTGSGTSAKYTSLINTLKTGNYISEPTPVDPKNVSPYQYTYTSNGSVFCLCARTEDTSLAKYSAAGTDGSCSGAGTTYYCVSNP